jgi:hypothetical protein
MNNFQKLKIYFLFNQHNTVISQEAYSYVCYLGNLMSLICMIYMIVWREADHSPRTSAEVKKMWIYTSTPPYAFMA